MRTREQERALHAYECVAGLRSNAFCKDYKILAQDFGTNIMRSGLCAALAFVQRNVDNKANASNVDCAASRFMTHLTTALQKAEIPALAQVENGKSLFATVRELELDDYMLATREMLRLAIWLRRAVDTIDADRSEQDAGANDA